MSTYTQIIYQIVFSTKNRQPVLSKPNRNILFEYIWGIMKNKNCHLYRINGVEDHLHIVANLHPAVSLASLIKDIKVSNSAFIKQNDLFPYFEKWQDGYGAFTYSINEKENLINYVKNQEEHHKKISFRDEFYALLKENGVDFDEKYLI